MQCLCWKNTLDEININSILDSKEKKISELEETAIETIQKQNVQRKNWKENYQSISKQLNICKIEVLNGGGNIWRNYGWNFSKFDEENKLTT